MEMSDAIEKVNKRMFERILGRTNYLAVLFYSKVDCKQCEKVLEELERVSFSTFLELLAHFITF